MGKLHAFISLCLVIAFGAICCSCKHTDNKEEFYRLAEQGRAELLRDYEQNPETWKGKDLLVIGNHYFRANKFEEAIAVYEKFTIIDPLEPDGWIGIGNANLYMKRWDEAISNYKKAETLGGEDAVRMLAACYTGAGYFDKLVEITPRLKTYVRGKSERSRERYEAVGLVLASAVSMEPPSKTLFDEFVGYLPTRASDWPDDIREYAFEGFKLFGIPKRFQNAVKSKVLKPSDQKE